MSFTIRLSQDLTAVEAGATVPLSIEIVNKGEEADRFEMQVEGIDSEWTASPEPVFNIGAGETHTQKVFFKPPRASESSAGNYPYVVRVRSLNSGDSRTAQGVLQIKPFHHLSMEINPKKGTASPMRQQNVFTLMLTNLGNTEHTLQMSGSDPEEACTYEFATDQVIVGPGQQKPVEVTIRTANAGWIAPVRLFGFSITARSIQIPNVTASTQGQLERRPLLTTASLLLFAFLLAIGFLWYAFRPQPPTITTAISASTIQRGQSVHLTWKAEHANSVRLEVQHSVEGKLRKEPFEDLPLEGERDIQTTNEDTLTITATAVGDHDSKSSRPITISVQEATPPKAPTLTFKAASSHIKLGDPVLFTFTYSPDVVKLVLSPTNQEIFPPVDRIEVTPIQPGNKTYELFAYTKDGGVTSKKVTVDAEPVSEAVIDEFKATPQTVAEPETKTLISWTVRNARDVQLDDGTGTGLKTVEASGTIEVVIDHDVTLRIIANDAKNVPTSKKVTIKYKKLPVAPPATTNSGTTGEPPPTTGGAGTTGTTTGGN